ncbi:hypothetical protein GRI94_17450 [Erythrobacter jejuensis]|uniref:Uncharacterized protein n=2 Tax=Parerythrobacter jejuensis TaxID=795812 RepID=A0A845AWF1_9SPHN|nr:hypothetical protein [Parerythrobacter jejuensis]MXP33617.1 hypothetical protein [Parerythrobacter jejuensis]
MYENNHSFPGRETGSEEGGLRPLAWAELAARLTAQRDIRAVLQPRARETAASFNADAASRLAQPDYDKREINPDALADGKYPWAKPAGAADGAAQGDRETR